MPPEIRKEQLAAIRSCPPPFALIAGGRPDQARKLEKDGIPTYLHVPSPGLLRMFLNDGAGGSSSRVASAAGTSARAPASCSGRRCARFCWSTSAVPAAAKTCTSSSPAAFTTPVRPRWSPAWPPPLAERGVAVGVLMGTAYLFTREAVAGGAIVPRFQQEALAATKRCCWRPPRATRSAASRRPTAMTSRARSAACVGRANRTRKSVRTLEWMNIGRLRIASKGLDRARRRAGRARRAAPRTSSTPRGMYMIGQVAALHNDVMTHRRAPRRRQRWEQRLLGRELQTVAIVRTPGADARPCDVAIVGMACFYPKATSLAEYWENILDKVNAVTEVPAHALGLAALLRSPTREPPTRSSPSGAASSMTSFRSA